MKNTLENKMLDAAISWCDSNGINVLEPEQLASLVNSLYITVRDAAPANIVLVPLRPTRAMEAIFQQEDWQWADVLAAAESVTEEQYLFALEDDQQAQLEPVTPDWSQDSAAAESIREHQAICNLLLKEMRHIAGISTGQVKRVAEQALEAVQQAQPEQHLFEFWWAEYMPDATQEQAFKAWAAAPSSKGVGIEQAQPERAPLSLEKIIEIVKAIDEKPGMSDIDVLVEMTRAIEAHHGIKQGGQ